MYYPKPEPIKHFSRQKIYKLYLIGSLMAFIAGYINSAMLMEYAIPVSQMSGVASHLSEQIHGFDWSFVALSVTILLGFILGAFLSGLLIQQKAYMKTPNYGYGLLLNSALLLSGAFLIPFHPFATVILSAIACGLQNALVASYKGMQLRTTHMTGNATDLGVHMAYKIRTKTPWTWQTTSILLLLIGYILGGVVGLIAYQHSPVLGFVFPGSVTALLGLAYLSHYRQK